MIDVVDLFNACLYIQENLEADLSLLFIAQTVGLSRFRFHRVFKAWQGETLHEFVTRMRMQRAAFELSYPVPCSNRRSIKAIAFASGYKSLSSFSHAFSSYARLSPREYRNRALRRRPVRRWAEVDVSRLGPFPIAVRMEPAREIAVLEPRDARGGAGLPPASIVDRSSGARELFACDLLTNLHMRAHRGGPASARGVSTGAIGVDIGQWRRDVEGPGRDGGPRSRITLEAGRYAVVEGRGRLSTLYRAWRRHFDAWLTSTGECPRAGRFYVRLLPAAGDAGSFDFVAFIPLEAA